MNVTGKKGILNIVCDIINVMSRIELETAILLGRVKFF